MLRSHTTCLALVGLICLCMTATGWASVIFDDFNVNEGHFNQAPTFSSSSNVSSTSTADRITSDSLEGAGSEQIVAVMNTTNPARIRFVSGNGTVANNVSFNVT